MKKCCYEIKCGKEKVKVKFYYETQEELVEILKMLMEAQKEG
jgi:hypothetical protein